MTPSEVEAVYEAIALRLDAVGEDKRDLYLAKLALLLSHDVGDVERVRQRIEEAAQDLDA